MCWASSFSSVYTTWASFSTSSMEGPEGAVPSYRTRTVGAGILTTYEAPLRWSTIRCAARVKARPGMQLTDAAFEGPLMQRGIGVIAPFDLALERELWRWTPLDVSLHLARTPYEPVEVSLEMAELVSS